MDDFGFHFPFDYVADVAWVLSRSNFTFWPQPGGLDDQDWFLIRDVRTYFQLEQRLEWERKQGPPRGERARRSRLEDAVRDD